MADLHCARCEGTNVSLSEDSDDDENEFEDEDRPLGWCDDCGDYRYLEE